jgi:hypothetical protein
MIPAARRWILPSGDGVRDVLMALTVLLGDVPFQSAGYISANTEHPLRSDQPSNGQKWTLHAVFC